MAQRLMSFPNVIWEVQNVYSVNQQTSSAFNFLGVHWKLHFHYSSATQFIKIFLKRTAPCSNNACLLNVKTAVIRDDAPDFETDTSIDTSSSNEWWCIWNEDRQSINSCVGGSTLMFLCCIEPESRWREILHENIDKGMKLPEDNADMDSLRKDFGSLLEKHDGADVIFNCKGEKIYAHRAVLSSRSQVLADIFQNDMDELIHITETEPFILRLFLRYLYTGDVPCLPVNVAAKLYFLAHKYGMDILSKNCVIFMMDSLDVDAPEDTPGCSNEESLEKEICALLRNIRQVLCTDSWKQTNEVQLKMFLNAFHTLFKDIHSKFSTRQGNEVANEGVQRKKIKLIIEYNEE